MNFRKINIVTVIAFVSVFALTSCEKDDGAIPNRVEIEEVPAVTTVMQAGGATATITLANQAAFKGDIKLDLFFAGATPPDKIDVVVRKNATNTNVKVYKANVTALPATYSIVAQDIVDLFGGALTLNDTYDIGADIYVGAKKYENFPVTGANQGQSPNGMSGLGYNAFVRFSVK